MHVHFVLDEYNVHHIGGGLFNVQKEVIRSQSVESMPFLLSFACFCNGFIWTAYGGIKNDKFLYVRSCLGVVYIIYSSSAGLGWIIFCTF
jgi:hypothetical protein